MPVNPLDLLDPKKRESVLPTPGAIWRDRHWRIKGVPVGGKTAAALAYMETDDSNTPRGEYTRAHEMLHAAFSPERIPASNSDSYSKLEEVQIPTYMAATLDIPTEALIQHEKDKAEIFEAFKRDPNWDKMTRRERALVAMVFADSESGEDAERMSQCLNGNSKDMTILSQICNRVRQSAWGLGRKSISLDEEHLIQCTEAARFDLYFHETEPEEKPEHEDEDESEHKGKSKGKSKSKGKGEDEDEDAEDEEELDEPGESKRKEPKTPAAKSDFERKDDGEALWGEMTIETPPLPIPSKSLNLLMKRRLRDTGPSIQKLERITSDGYVFSQKMRVQGGTVVVDTSGSMSIRQKDVSDLLEQAPAATVAVYQGNGTTGVLRIVVRKGKMVRPEDLVPTMGGENTVDGPALDWLATQPGPRYWVSDGYVVGVLYPNGRGGSRSRDGTTTAHMNYCSDRVRRHRILRINDIRTAIELLKARRTYSNTRATVVK